jgi:hypothetical protein
VLARFIGAFIAAYLVYAASSFGFALATLMPWLDPGLIGPFTLWHYVYASVFIGLPALFANSVIVYAFAVLTRDQRIAYAVIIALLVAYQVAASMLGQMDYRVAAALVDPTGSAAIGEVMQYWTVFERNTQVVPIEGTLLLNRLLWLAIGALLLGVTVRRFDFLLSKTRQRKKKIEDGDALAVSSRPVGFSTQHAETSASVAWHQFLARTGFEVRAILRSVFFWVLLALAAALSLGNFFSLSQIYGTPVYPVTRALIQVLSGSVTLSLMIIIVFYGADLIWRDRESRYQDILGASAAPSWTFVLAKMVAALMVVLIFLAETALVAVLFQLFSGYTNLELGLYVIGYLYDYGVLFYLAIGCRADPRAEQVRRHAGDGCLPDRADHPFECGLRRPAVPVWRHERHPLLGHERLRWPARPCQLVHVVLVVFRDGARRCRLRVVESRPTGEAQRPGDQARCEPDAAGRRYSVRRRPGLFRAHGLDLLQHARCQRVHDQRRQPGICGKLREEVRAPQRPADTAIHRRRNGGRPLP